MFGAVLLLPPPADAQTIPPAIENLAQGHVSKRKNKGLVLAIVNRDNLQIKGYGKISDTNDAPPNAHTIFEVGAITEVFTSSLMVISAQKGLFDTGDPIEQYLPTDVHAPTFQTMKCVEITMPGNSGSDQPQRIVSCAPDPLSQQVCIAFCDLATHTSGLSQGDKNYYVWNPFIELKQRTESFKDCSRATLFEQLYGYDLRHAPGTSFHYSNLGMALLGHIISDQNGLTYSALLERDITGPLDLKDTRLALSALQKKRLAIPHNSKGKVSTYYHFDGMAPSAGLYSSAWDLARFVIANLDTKNEVLADAFEQAQQARLDVHFPGLERPTEAGYGWLISKLSSESNQPVVWQNGGTGGFRAFIGFVKDSQMGIVLLSNSANDVTEMGFQMLKELVEPGK